MPYTLLSDPAALLEDSSGAFEWYNGPLSPRTRVQGCSQPKGLETQIARNSGLFKGCNELVSLLLPVRYILSKCSLRVEAGTPPTLYCTAAFAQQIKLSWLRVSMAWFNRQVQVALVSVG